jgi:hypothetical protein
MTITRITAIVVAAVVSAGAASAATLSFTGVDATKNLSITYDLQTKAGYDAIVPVGVGRTGNVIEIINGKKKDASNGVSVSGPARVTYTFLGSEAGNSNFSALMGTLAFTNSSVIGAKAMDIQGAGLLEFAFGTTAPESAKSLIMNNGIADPANKDYAIGYSNIFNDNKSILVFFDDIKAGDGDFDDLAMRIDVAAVPLPAAGLLLVGALGALGVARRRAA